MAIKKRILVGVKSGELEFYAQRPLVAGDTAAYEIVLTAPYDLEGAVFAVSAKRADGVVVSDIGSISAENGRMAAVYTLKNNIYAIAGMLEMDLQLCKDGGVLTECRLLCDVCEGHTMAEVAGDDRLPILAELINKVSLSADAAQNAAETAAAASAAAVSASSTVESALSGVSAAVVSALNAATNATNAAFSATNAASAAYAAAQRAEDSAGVTVICTGSNDNIKIQAAMDTASANAKTRISIKGTAGVSQTIGSVGGYDYYMRIPQNKEIVLDFSGCKDLTLNCVYTANSQKRAVFYQEGNLEVTGLKATLVADETGYGLGGQDWLVYAPSGYPKDTTLRNCKYETRLAGGTIWGQHHGIDTYGNVYMYGSDITLGGADYLDALAMRGSGKAAYINDCVISSTITDGRFIDIAGSSNTLYMRGSTIKSSTSGMPVLLFNTSGALFAAACNIVCRTYSGSSSISMYNGEVKDCSISDTAGNAVMVNAGGTRGGAVVVNNVLYNGRTVVNNAGTNTFLSNNMSTSKVYPV